MPHRDPQRPLLKPPPLASGDAVGIVAPASNVDRALLERGCETLRKLGYRPVYSDSIFERDLYFAGSIERRVRELHEMFARDDVRAILCARGGYGCNYLLPHLDLDLIRRHPKIFVGYSDITALLTYLHDQTGLVTFHGPMVTKDFAATRAEPAGVHLASWQCAVAGWFGYDAAESDVVSLADGEAEGKLYGGCLSILVASLGTPYEVATDDAILLLEDRGEKPYRVDRMLRQLALAGKLSRVRGFVFGEMLDCVQPEGQDYSLQEIIVRVLRECCPAVPVVFGFRSGHVSRANITLPLGVRARLCASGSDVRLTVLESAVDPPGRDVNALIAAERARGGRQA